VEVDADPGQRCANDSPGRVVAGLGHQGRGQPADRRVGCEPGGGAAQRPGRRTVLWTLKSDGKLIVRVVVRSAAVNTGLDDALFDPDALRRGR